VVGCFGPETAHSDHSNNNAAKTYVAASSVAAAAAAVHIIKIHEAVVKVP
jgi:hypothetical protein